MTDPATLRAVLEERRTHVLADLVALEAPPLDGAPDPSLTARLRANSEDELREVDAALGRLGDARPRRRHRRLPAVAVVAVALAALAALTAGAVEPRRSGGFVTGGVASSAAGPTTSAPRDLGAVTNEELEEVVQANPSIVPMRLALVERYLRAGDAARARTHALRALEEPIEGAERARALKYLGWSTALVGRPAEGSALLEESLAMVPDDLDTMWFLANVRLDAKADAAGAVTLLERILAEHIPDDRRKVVADRLQEARRVAGTSTGQQ
jgi:hypothetical protein